MSRLLGGIRAGVSAAIAVGVIQSVLETLLIGALNSSYILAPGSFFNVKVYDGFAKLHAIAAESLGLPTTGMNFMAGGFAAKLALLPELLAINIFVAAIVGIVIGIGLAPFVGSEPVRATRRLVFAVVLIELIVHVVLWAGGVHLPVDPSFNEITRNAARNLLYDGTLLSIVVALGTLPIAFAIAGKLVESRPILPVSLGLAAVLGVWLAARTPAVEINPSATLWPEVAANATAPAKDYNVILISIDSLRADHLSAYGYERDTSPTIKALADDGVLCLNNSSTTAWTLPGHMSMMTGRTLLGHGVVSDDRMLTDDVATLAESLHDGGYTTGAIVSAPYVEARYGFGRGFDHYDDNTIKFATHGESYKQVTAPKLQETAASWLSSNADRKLFLFLHYWDVHYDYAPGPPYDTMFDPDYDGDIDGVNFYFNPRVNRRMDERDLEHVLALYDGEIRLVDDHLAKLRGTLESLGIADRTIIIVTSDHGDEFFEHGRKGHHRSLYDEILRVPLVIYVPGEKAVRPVLEMETSIIDIMPTVLSLVGLPIPSGVEGEDLSRVAYGDTKEWDRRTLSELYRLGSLNCQVSMRDSNEKLIHHFNRRLIERYAVTEDPSEATDLGDGGEMLAEMHGALEQLWPVYWSRVSRNGINEVVIDSETEARLKALGYLDD